MTETKIPFPARFAATFGEKWEGLTKGIAIGANVLAEGGAWFVQINRILVEQFAKRHFPESYRLLEGDDLRLMRAFLEVESVSNTVSLLGGRGLLQPGSELLLGVDDIKDFAVDAFGPTATHDTSKVVHDADWNIGDERWFFINGIATSLAAAKANVDLLRQLTGKRFTLIHNPTQGLVHDIVESAIQKFTNVNTESVGRAFVEIADALLEDKDVHVVAHSQGSIVMGDVLDLIYCSVSYDNFKRTNMSLEEFEDFMRTSHGTVRSYELHDRWHQLEGRAELVCKRLHLYMFANGASRMCYLHDKQALPFIESYANEHDIVTRLGSLARDEFHAEDIVRIDGPLFIRRRYGHLLNAHYLSDLDKHAYEALLSNPDEDTTCVGASVHELVRGNPAGKNERARPALSNDVKPRFVQLVETHKTQRHSAQADTTSSLPRSGIAAEFR